VELGAPALQQVLVDHVVQQRVDESEARFAAGFEQAGLAQLVQYRGTAADAREEIGVEDRSEDLGFLERGAQLRRQPVDA
jgi:hypothetical protein